MHTRNEVIEANIKLHTALADVYKHTEPHYRPENIERIDGVLKTLQKNYNGESLLDIGCGAGFIIDIAKKYFKTIRGIDITPTMLAQINTESETCDIKVELGNCEDLTFGENTFDACSAYAVLHHLHDIPAVMQEVYRVLKPGGVFYSDLDPNHYFWSAISKLSKEEKYSDIVAREYHAVLYKDDELEEQFNVEKDILHTAEYLKHDMGGFKEEDMIAILKKIGFTSVKIQYEWFLGEGNIIHGEKTKEAANIMREYMRDILPLSRHLFKYISIYAIK